MSAGSTCQGCGTPLSGDALFCARCGMDVTLVHVDDATQLATTAGAASPPVRSTMRQSLRDATLGEYEILDELGRGGMATVFRAHDVSLDRKVAIKVMAAHLVEGEGMSERFKLEARTSAQLSHPHIIPIYAVKETESTLFFVMKYIEGRALDEIIRKTGPLPIPMVRDILGKVGGALGYAHRRNVVHRDVKPANIMVDEEGTPIVTDFGIAKVAEAKGLTMTGTTIGTPSYMSPEQCEAKPVTGASDQYSLGVVAFEMLTGRLPFEGESAVSTMYKHCHDPIPPLRDFRPDCPQEIVDTVTRMLAKNPADRWPTLEAAMQKMGTGTLAALDPVSSQLLRAAQEGDLERVAQLATPRGGMQGVATAPLSRAPVAGRRAGVGRVLVAGIAIVAAGVLGVTRPWEAGAPASLIDASETGSGEEDPSGPRPTGGDPATPVTTDGGAPATAQPGADGGAPGPSQPAPGGAGSVTGGSGADAGGASVPVTDALPAGSAGGAAVGTRPTGGPSPTPSTATATIQVASVAIAGAEGPIEVGQVVRLGAIASERGGARIAESVISECGPHGWRVCGYQWSSSAESVAAVDRDGVLTARAPGSAVVEVTVGGVTGRTSVEVTALPAAAMVLDRSTLSMAVGEPSATLTAVVTDRTGTRLTNRAVQWSSSDPGVARVGADGAVTPLSPGSAVVTATVEGLSARSSVTVEAAAVDARTAIASIIGDYARALTARDVDAVRRAFPGLSQQDAVQLRNTFAGTESLEAVLAVESLDERGDAATAEVSGTYRFVAGGRRSELPVRFTAVFERAAGAWRFIERRDGS